MAKNDVNVEVTDDSVIIQGERRICRVVPLPEGAIGDNANASFKDGVLEITMPAPPRETRGRRIEITEGTKTP